MAGTGPGAETAINVSALDLADPGFAGLLAAQLAKHGVPPSGLIVEITESAEMADPELAMGQLQELCELGVQLSIDGYGTGYSSMAQLKRLPVHELKIDEVLRPRPAEHDTIVRSTIKLGHNMGLKIVAEGVETEAILERLDQPGCDIAQG
ncbi:EAL domain-containing protein [Pseudomonas sp. EA_35y_Pfl2_R5]|uniref:EAL domain-containing protein n=1 Tax=Pseudomonas sp. EA_35y_Pfl2_R5 TaxID=3088690 RepID=UPI00403F5C32